MNAQSWAKYADARVREEIHNALESLPESERTVLTLYYMAGMTCDEIGRFIGTSCSAIRDRLYRARIRLKEELTMIEETLGGFQLPPALTQEIMRRILNVPLTSGPTSKPLVPWSRCLSAWGLRLQDFSCLTALMRPNRRRWLKSLMHR